MNPFPFHMRCCCLGLWLAWLLPLVGAAQPVQQLETGFEREVNRYRWIANLDLAQTWGAWQVAAQNRFASDAFILFADQLSFRDENRFAWQATRPLNPRFGLHLRGQADWYSLGRVFSQQAYAGLRYQPHPTGWVEPLVGVALDQRPGAAAQSARPPLRTDIGPAVGMRFAWQPAPVDDYRFQVAGTSTWHRITPRQDRSVQVAGGVERAFAETQLAVTVVAATFRRDAYQAASFLNRDPSARADETIEATTNDTLLASVRLDAPFLQHFRLTSQLDFGGMNRFIRTLGAQADALVFDTDFNRRTIDLDLGLAYQRPALTARLGLRTGAEVERRALANRDDLPPTQAAQKSNLLRQADYDEGALALRAHLLARPSARLAFSFDGTASIRRHDTPDLNPDDRDEIFYTGLLGLRYRFSRYFEADARLFSSYYHTVYLKAARSADNNVQRSLRLSPTLRWNPSPRTQIELQTEVRATYTVDDFVLPGRRASDQSARELRYAVEAEHDFGAGTRLRIRGGVSDLQLGRFLRDVFAEIPFDTLRTYDGWVRLQAGQRLVAEVGLRTFIRTDYQRSATVTYPQADADGGVLTDTLGAVLTTTISRPGRERILQIGPTCALIWPLRNGSTVRFDGWLTAQHVRQFLYGDLPEASADRIRRAAREGRRTLIPNLSVTAVWRF